MSTPVLSTETRNRAVTLEDTRKALGDVRADATNCNKLRAIIGFGSQSTIQKHIEIIREEQRKADAPPAPNVTQKMPADVADLLWSVAITAAEARTLSAHVTLSAERDALFAQVNLLTADLAAATDAGDAAIEQIETDALRFAAELEAAQAAAAVDKAAAEAATVAAASTAAELARVTAAASTAAELAKRDAENAAELSKRDAQIAAQAYQLTVDRLTDQVAELKAWRISAPAQRDPE